jgi:hypothetical protein
LDPNQRRRTAHQPLNPTLDLEHAHVTGHSGDHDRTDEFDPRSALGQLSADARFGP